MEMIQQFQQFRQSMTPAGAKAKVEEMLNSGQMSREQLNQLEQQAQSILSMMRR